MALHREMNVDARAVDHQRGPFSAHHLLIKPRIKLEKVMPKYMLCTDCVLRDRGLSYHYPYASKKDEDRLIHNLARMPCVRDMVQREEQKGPLRSASLSSHGAEAEVRVGRPIKMPWPYLHRQRVNQCPDALAGCSKAPSCFEKLFPNILTSTSSPSPSSPTPSGGQLEACSYLCRLPSSPR